MDFEAIQCLIGHYKVFMETRLLLKQKNRRLFQKQQLLNSSKAISISNRNRKRQTSKAPLETKRRKPAYSRALH